MSHHVMADTARRSAKIFENFSEWSKAFGKFHEDYGKFMKLFSHFDFYFPNKKSSAK